MTISVNVCEVTKTGTKPVFCYRVFEAPSSKQDVIEIYQNQLLARMIITMASVHNNENYTLTDEATSIYFGRGTASDQVTVIIKVKR